MKESSFEKKFMDKVSKLPNTYCPPKGDAGSTIGNADRVICINGKYVSLEFKKSMKETLKKTKRSKLQLYNSDRVHMAGGFAVFVYPENSLVVYNQLEELSK